jgi:hypothetical protein
MIVFPKHYFTEKRTKQKRSSGTKLRLSLIVSAAKNYF